MVMDATQPQPPSPQSVGREFVRQYYTLLNKAPNHLHRFYNNHSSFIHGEATLVVGQKNIHNRIQQLNFHDCHAKISQVDAQATLGNGVVVQVTGELSNNGQPMRRFTQTFVLAAQSPKKYYVHNDIFRYQDVYSDEENDGESRSENDDDHEQTIGHEVLTNEQQPLETVVVSEQQQQLPAQVVAANAGGVLPQQQQQQAQAGAPQQAAIYYSVPPSAGARGVALVAPPQVVQIAGQYATPAVTGVHAQQVQATATAVTQLNGVVAHDDLLPNMQQPTAAVAAQQQQPLVTQAVTPIVQPAAAVPVVGGAAVLTAQTSAGGAAVPVANAATAVPGFTAQSPIVQHQIIQQQQQAQQPLTNTSPQQPILQSQPPQAVVSNNVEVDDGIGSGAGSPPATNETVSRNASTVVPTPEQGFSPPAPIVDDFKTINEQQQQEKYEAAKQQQQQQNEPKTYANLFKSTSSSPSGFVNAAMQQQHQLQQQQQQHHQHQQQQHQHQSSSNSYPVSSNIASATYSQSNSSSSLSGYNNRAGENHSSSLRTDNNIGSTNTQGGGPLPQRMTSRVNKDFEQRRPSNAQQFGDNQQLFLGNIPHHAPEEDLRAMFSRFGTVVELRILSKSGSKLPPGVRNPLNYGFITYEDAESVQKCLSHCPLYYPENSPDRQKLNVEEKKPRIRQNDLPPRLNMGGGSNMNNMSNNQRNNMSGPQSRSLSNTGSGNMMRGGNNASGGSGNNISRGGSGGGSGSRIGGSFTRNENRSGPTNGGGPQVRSGNNNTQTGGGNYGGRR